MELKMEISYIILAHQRPKQVKRLLEKLASEGCRFYIHIDKNVDIRPFKTELAALDQAYFLPDEKREEGTWGDFGIVKATINALRQIIKVQETGYVVLLSGQDYPLKSNAYIRSFLIESYGTYFISVRPMPRLEWDKGGMNRLLHYKSNISARKFHHVLLPSIWEREFYKTKILKNICLLFLRRRFRSLLKLFKKRRFPTYLKPYCGDQWWALPVNAVRDILDFLDRHPDYCAYHNDSLLPDEMFFQSIVMHLTHGDTVAVKPTLTYTNWSRRGVPLPVTFTRSDIDELKVAHPDKLFARKFDIEADEWILNQLDELRWSNDMPK
jgi:Core-2/I-Branching enzyme